jgi:hypothetical protein
MSNPQDLKACGKNIVEDFRHDHGRVLRNFYNFKEKQNIKKFHFTSVQNISQVFIGVFIALLPFSMIPRVVSWIDRGFYFYSNYRLGGWVYM